MRDDTNRIEHDFIGNLSPKTCYVTKTKSFVVQPLNDDTFTTKQNRQQKQAEDSPRN